VKNYGGVLKKRARGMKFLWKRGNGTRQNARDGFPHKMKRNIHSLRSLQRPDGILKACRMMAVNFVIVKFRIKRGCPKCLPGVPVNGFSKTTCTAT
jgi:hypothetical protein